MLWLFKGIHGRYMLSTGVFPVLFLGNLELYCLPQARRAGLSSRISLQLCLYWISTINCNIGSFLKIRIKMLRIANFLSDGISKVIGGPDVHRKSLSEKQDGEPAGQVLETEESSKDSVNSSGQVTVVDAELGWGVIEGQYRFKISKFRSLGLCEGDLVNFTAASISSELSSYGWDVTKISIKERRFKDGNFQALSSEILQSPEGVKVSESQSVSVRDIKLFRSGPTTIRQKYVLCKVAFKPRDENYFNIYFPPSPSTEQFQVLKEKFGPAQFLLVGDWLKLKLERKNNLEEGATFSFSEWEIKGIEWAEQGFVVGQIVSTGGLYCVQDIFCPQREFNKKGQNLKVGDFCKVKYVLSDQFKTQPEDGEAAYFPKRSCVVEIATKEAIAEYKSGHTLSILASKIEQLCRNKNNVVIHPPQVRFGTFKVGSCIRKQIEISNQGRQPASLTAVKLQCDQQVCDFTFEMADPEGGRILKTIEPGGSITITLICTPALIGRTTEICIFEFGSFVIGRKVSVHALPEDVERFESINRVAGAKKSKKGQRLLDEERRLARMVLENRAEIIKGPASVRPPFFLPFVVPPYKIPEELEEVYLVEQCQQGKGSTLMQKLYPEVNWNELTSENYLKRFHAALWLEELEINKLRKDLDLSGVHLAIEEDLMHVTVPYLSESKPVIFIGERVRCHYTEDAEKVGLNAQDSDDEEESPVDEDFTLHVHEGYIHKIVNQDVYFKFTTLHTDYDITRAVNVTFKQRRTNHKRQHHSVELALELLGESWLFPDEASVEIKTPRIQFIEESVSDNDEVNEMATQSNDKRLISLPSKKLVDIRLPSTYKQSSRRRKKKSVKGFGVGVTLEWFNKGLNPEQKDTVRRILRGQCRPLPYIIFGPPGTGKTVTLVEAVMQVNQLDSNSRIVVCVPSNQAADLIAERLVQSRIYVPGDFVRLNGFLRSGHQVPESIVDFCSDGENLNAVMRHRIVISTISTAGQFFQLRITPDHFTHVFIDEASYATEPEALVSCVLSAVGKEGQIILSGDPNQLLPVLHHRSEVHKILRRSLLERLMSTTVYAPNPDKYVEKYNPVFITMLTRSYRLPKALLDLPSARFYNNNLISKADVNFDLLEKLEFLPNKRIPLMFHGLTGRCQHGGSPSWYNIDEVFQCLQYVDRLRASGIPYADIGIISLYRKQVDVLKSYLKERIPNEEEIPKVATIQEFQGGERKVIIISTVISTSQDYLERVSPNAFILSSKMFNVSVTRAKSLLILVGDPTSLQFSSDWMAMIKYCLKLGVYFGCQLPPVLAAPSILSRITDGVEGSECVEPDGCDLISSANVEAANEVSDHEPDEYDGYGETTYISRFDS